MGFLDIFKAPDKIGELDRSVSSSFARVRSDTDALYKWVHYLYNQNRQLAEQNNVLRRLVDEQKLSLNELKVTLAHIPKTAAEIKRVVDAHVNLQPIFERIKHIEQKIELLEIKRSQRPFDHSQPSVHSLNAQTHQAPVQPAIRHSVPPRPSMRERLARKIARNSKDYVKNLILGLVHKYDRIGALQLREIVVEEQALCSRSSFYRILNEMEKDGLLEVVSTGKHTVYSAATHR